MRTAPPKVYEPIGKNVPWTPLSADALGINTPFYIERFIRDKVVNKNESWDIFIAGDRGVGKSACAMSLAMMLDPKFTVDHWAFTAKRYVELMTHGYPKGTVVVFDDMGTSSGGSSRKWQGDDAHNLADLAQLGRTDGIITIGTSLQLSRTEIRLRAGFKVICQPIVKLSAQQTGYGYAIDAEFRYRVVDAFADTVHYKLFRSASGNRVKYIRLHHPPQPVWDEYQAMRQTFLDSIKAAQGGDTPDDVAPVYSSQDWAREMSTTVARVGVHRLVVRDISDTPYAELLSTVRDAYDVDRSSASSVIRQLKDSGIVGVTGNQKAQIFNLTPKGKDFVNKRPVPEVGA